VPRFVCLLRGVNVGGRNAMAMSELRALVESLGHSDVSTFIQSGNVIFSAPADPGAARLEAAIRARFELDVPVVLRTASELQRAVATNPFPAAEQAKLHVGFMARRPPAAALAGLDGGPFLPDEFVVQGKEVYLHLPSGMARTKLPAYLDRRLKLPITYRNRNTLARLCELARG
jgi:uncharacterized protein (DUF1697 family)